METGLSLAGVAQPARVVVNGLYPAEDGPDARMSGQELVETASQLLLCVSKLSAARTSSVIHSAVARDLASLAVRVMYEREASSISSGGVASSMHGADRSAAALAYLSAVSFPCTPT